MMAEPVRKALARVVAESRHESMVHQPTRWPKPIWNRFVARAKEKGLPVSDVVRECGIAGLGYLETEDALREHRRTTA